MCQSFHPRCLSASNGQYLAPGIAGVALFVLTVSLAVAAAGKEQLAQPYRDWLNKEVTYIITSEERDAFLRLPDAASRDKFIERFWEIRNPTPGAPDNPYKSEHYRRLEYANQYFGHVSHTEGWRTDMGRIYITLGAPAQKQVLLGASGVRPSEIWFFQNASAALPPFFYIVFFQRDASSEFKLYSPYGDGPEKLVQSVVGPSRQQALKAIQQDAGREVARISLSLIPDEPVDFENGTVSLQSDVMLSTIKNLANHPVTKEELANRRRILEDVSHRIVLGTEFLDATIIPLRDSEGNTNIHYVVRLQRPEDFAVGQTGDNYYYNISVSAVVSTRDGKQIFRDERNISRKFDGKQLEQIKGKLFGYEGVLPLAPGKYKLEFLLANNLNRTTYRCEKDVVVPEANVGTLSITGLVPFEGAEMVTPDRAGNTPFTGAGVRFVPMVGGQLDLVQGQELQFFYQLWAPSSATSGAALGNKFDVEYVYGRMGARDTQKLKEEIGSEQLDAMGSMISGKRIPTVDLNAGSYRLVVTLHDQVLDQKAYATLNFRVVPVASARPTAAFDITDDQLGADKRSGLMDYQRALCYLAFNESDQGIEWLHKAFEKSRADERFRGKLVELYFEQHAYPQIVDILSRSSISKATDEQTIMRIVESLQKVGNTRRAVQVLEEATALNPTSGPLYLTLASYYRSVGENEKASAVERKGKSLMATAPAS